MSPTAALSKLILLVYEAATEPSLWPSFMQAYNEAFDADFSVLQIHHFDLRRSEILAQFGFNPRFNSLYSEQYSQRNLWRDCGRKVYTTGVVYLEEEICPRRVTTSSEFYHDFLMPMGVTRSIGPVLHRDSRRAVTMPAMRAENKEPFGEEERAFAEQLLPHLARAFQILERLQVMQAGEEVLAALPFGVAFLNGSGFVIQANREAERIFGQGDGLGLRLGALTAESSKCRADLAAAIQQNIHVEGNAAWPKTMLVERPSALRPYQVLSFPLRGEISRFRGLRAPSVVVFIVDPEQQLAQAPEILASLFGLTKKEAAVATKLAEGKSPEQLAGELGMRYETARTHIRRIFDKTATSRQSQLVSLLARIPAAVRPEDQ